MTVHELQVWLTIIPAIAAAIVSIITALRVNIVKEKVSDIHTLVNANFQAQKQEIADLRVLLMVAQGAAVQAESARSTLAGETAASLQTVSTPPIIKP